MINTRRLNQIFGERTDRILTLRQRRPHERPRTALSLLYLISPSPSVVLRLASFDTGLPPLYSRVTIYHILWENVSPGLCR